MDKTLPLLTWQILTSITKQYTYFSLDMFGGIVLYSIWSYIGKWDADYHYDSGREKHFSLTFLFLLHVHYTHYSSTISSIGFLAADHFSKP